MKLLRIDDIIIPKMAIPEVGRFAQCADTEGNVFGITKMDNTVKQSI